MALALATLVKVGFEVFFKLKITPTFYLRTNYKCDSYILKPSLSEIDQLKRRILNGASAVVRNLQTRVTENILCLDCSLPFHVVGP